MKQVTIDIGPGGEARVSVAGVAGSSCRELTAGIEAALGRVETVEPTAEYHAQEEQGEGQGEVAGSGY